MIDGWNFFEQPIKNDLKTFDDIRKTATSQGDDYTTGCLLDYHHFKMYYKLIAIDLSKQQNLNADPKAIQQINFAGNLTGGEGALMFFIIEEAKEKVLEFKLKRVTTPTHPHSPYSPQPAKIYPPTPTHP